jgi:hypothetical protein
MKMGEERGGGSAFREVHTAHNFYASGLPQMASPVIKMTAKENMEIIAETKRTTKNIR